MKAIIPAAGYGTRFLPATKTVPKEMLPVGNKPAIQWIVEEALAAGAEEVVIVTSPDKPSIRKHFEPDAVWRERLRNRPEADAEMARVEMLASRVRFVDQLEQRGLGHAVLQAAPLFSGGDGRMLILLGDALVASDLPCSQAIVRKAGAIDPSASWVGLERVPMERVSRYGVVRGRLLPDEERVYRVEGLVEKPSPEEAPSDLAIAGRYLLSTEIFGLLSTQKPGKGGEIQLTDALVRLLDSRPVYGFRYPGRRLDIGNPAGYLDTLNVWAEKGR